MSIFFNNNQRPINPERTFSERVGDFFRPKITSPLEGEPDTFLNRVKELFKANVKSPVSDTNEEKLLNRPKPAPTPSAPAGPAFAAPTPTPEPTPTPVPQPSVMPQFAKVSEPIPQEKWARNPKIVNYKINSKVKSSIDQASQKFGLIPTLMFDIALQESYFDPALVNTTPEGVKAGNPTGLFQFTDNTWEVVKKFANDPDSALYKLLPNLDRKDPLTNSLAAAYLIKYGQLGRWEASKDVWGPYYTEDELNSYYAQTLSYNQ